MLQHIHDKTIIVEDIKNTITLKKKKKKKQLGNVCSVVSETGFWLYIVFKWLVSARVLHVKNSCTTTKKDFS